MPWVTPPTVVAGDIILASWGNTYVRDNTAYLKNVIAGLDTDKVALAALPTEVQRAAAQPRFALAQLGTAFSVNNTVDATLQFHSTPNILVGVSLNLGSSWAASVNILTAGTYLFGGFTVFAANATGYRQTYITKNGASGLGNATVQGTAVAATQVPLSGMTQCAAGDVIEVHASQNSGGPLNITAVLWGVRVGP